MKYVLAMALAAIFALGTAVAHADGFWLYCDGSPVICTTVTPTVTSVTIEPVPVAPAAAPATAPVPAPVVAPPLSAPNGMATSSNVNLRSGPATTYPSLGVVPAGTVVQQRGPTSGVWVPVTVGGTDGWIPGAYLTGV